MFELKLACFLDNYRGKLGRCLSSKISLCRNFLHFRAVVSYLWASVVLFLRLNLESLDLQLVATVFWSGAKLSENLPLV